MSSEESLSSDTDYKNNNSKNKMKQRKPDMQVYVPRAKRIEDQVKQRMSSEFPSAVVDEVNAAVGDAKSRLSLSPSPERHQAKLFSQQQQREFRPTWDEKGQNNSKDRMKKNDNQERIELPRPSLFKKGPPPPQPQPNKLPSQVIQEMLKRHNINVPSPEEAATKLSLLFKEEDTAIEKADESILEEPPAKTEGDSSILSCLPASYQDFIMEEIALTTAAHSQRLASTDFGPLSSASPTNSESNPDLQQLPSRASPSLDAEDLEVKMINESFEEAQKQMQLYGSEAVKKAFYSQPNPGLEATAATATAPKSRMPSGSETPAATAANIAGHHSTTSTSTGPSKLRSSTDDKPAKPVLAAECSKPSGTSSASSSSASGSGSGKLTWAGWGSKKDESKTTANTKPPKMDSDFSNSFFSAMSSTPSMTSLGAAIGISESQMPPVPSFLSTASSPVFDSPPNQMDENQCEAKTDSNMDTNEMDVLSAAMIEKVLSDDGDDFETATGGESKFGHVGKDNPNRRAKSSSNDVKAKRNLEDIWNRGGGTEAHISSTGASGSGAAEATAAESWEDLFDEPGEKLIAQLMKQVKVDPTRTEVERAEINYFTIQSRDVEIDEGEFGHVIEAYGFPSSVKGDELYLALRQLHLREFRIEWVDETHALVVFATAMAAQEACDDVHPVIKLRPISQASAASRKKAKKMKDMLHPYARRPTTSAVLARRLVEGHLGKRSELGVDQRRRERELLQQAKDQKKIAAQQREDAWEGRL